MKKQTPMSFEHLISRSFGKESSSFWRGGPRGLSIENVRRYLDEGGDPNRRTESGQTLLHIATDNGQVELMQLLVARGADGNARGHHGYTPLHLAVDTDCDTSRLGADELARDDDGETARDVAVAYSRHETQLYDDIPRHRGT